MDVVIGNEEALCRLGVRDIVAGIARGDFDARQLLQSCLQRIEEREPQIRAWASIDAEVALAAAARAQAGPLGGVPFAVKDVIDTARVPTQMGSRVYEGHQPRYDAGCVGQARMAGAIVLGKTVTAEFAGTDATTTTNPRAPGHTPGGSSSGSAAAVADFMVPFAFGTQTGGSVLRPAAFCGVVGFKPTYGFYTIAGMKPAAHSFDTVGLIARSVSDIALVHGVLMGSETQEAAASAPRIGLFRSHLWDTVDDDSRRATEQAIAALERRGASIVEVEAPPGFESITESRAVINAFERARGLAGEWSDARDRFAPRSTQVCERGFAVTGSAYVDARRMVENFRMRADQALFAQVDLLLTPATPGPAPLGLDYAGDPRLQELWTMLHMPSMTIPAGASAGGLPLSIQLVAPRFEDERLLAQAQWVARIIAGSGAQA